MPDYNSVHTDTVIGSANPPKRRRIIRNMRMTKIDAVDNPAQETAEITICKTADSPVELDREEILSSVQAGILEAHKGERKMDAQLRKDIAGVVRETNAEISKNAEEAAGEADDEARAEILEVEDAFLSSVDPDIADVYKSLPEDEQVAVLVEFAEDPETSLDTLDEASDISKAVESGEITEDGEVEDDEDIDLDSIDPDSLSDQDKVVLFDAMALERQATKDGDVVTKAMEGELAKRDAQIAELQAESHFQKAVSTAEAELPNFPGSPAEKAALLMSLENLPTQQANLLLKAMRQTDAMVEAGGFDEVGTNSTFGDSVGAQADGILAKAANKIAKDTGCTPGEAYIQALNSPEGSELYKASAELARLGHGG